MGKALTADSVERLVNLTPHDVSILGQGGEVLLSVDASGTVARLIEVSGPARVLRIGGVEVPAREMDYADRIEGLTPPEPGIAYLVSRVLAQAVRRVDLYFPADEVRDQTGQIIGCTALGQFLSEEP